MMESRSVADVSLQMSELPHYFVSYSSLVQHCATIHYDY